MNVLFVSNDPLIFIADSAVRNRLRAYAAYFNELHVVSVAAPGTEKIEEENLFLYPVITPKAFRVVRLARMARAVIRARSIVVVSAQDPFEHGLAALCATLGTPALLHVQAHTDFLSRYFARESFKNRLRVLVARPVLWFSDGLRVVSERIKQSIRARYGLAAPEASVIPVSLPDGVGTAVPLPQNAYMFSLITASRLEPEKHVEDILAALVLARRKYPGIGLFIAGEGSLREPLTQRALELGISENVMFLGARTDVRGLMQSAQAYVCASAYEGYGLSLIEAALAGLPIVTTDVGVVGDVLIPETDVLTFAVGNSEALAEHMLRLIDKATLCENLSTHAKRAAEAHVMLYKNQPALVAADIARVVGNDSISRP